MANYAIGIDLGTTNCVLAYAPLEGDRPVVETFLVPQLVAAGTLESRSVLPSFLYLAAAEQAPPSVRSRAGGGKRSEGGGAYNLPWASGRDFAVGEWARRQAADVPDRTVGGAKSWLAYSQVDRRRAILPWGAPAEVPKVSPVTASQRYLEHLVAAWESAFPHAPLKEQLVVLTVPASFDASARELTREAALAAGLPEQMVLLEEPQAAVYAWLADTGDGWRRLLAVGDKLLVCDVGGGTTDLTLVNVTQEAGELALERMAVGNHLLVGGDNMDLALAHLVAGQLAGQGAALNPWQSIALWHSCRTAKEALLSSGGPENYSVAVMGRGSRLIGGSVSIEIGRQAVGDLLLDGFFPRCAVADRPARRRLSGFRELGLPFETDTAITRHVAAFLQDHGELPGHPVRPSHVLPSGGVFKADRLQARLLEVLGQWFPGAEAPQLLPGRHDLDHAVARGAAYYGWAKRHGGVRIRGGTARSYYVGIETAGLAVPGAPRPLEALCVVPLGMEEGTETDVPSEEIGLVVGEGATFRFFSSPVRRQDRPGNLLSQWNEEEIQETDSLETALPRDESIEEDYVPVRFHAKVTELGMLELWCYSTKTAARWKLEFSVRPPAEGGAADDSPVRPRGGV
jgi:hypothetical protein